MILHFCKTRKWLVVVISLIACLACGAAIAGLHRLLSREAHLARKPSQLAPPRNYASDPIQVTKKIQGDVKPQEHIIQNEVRTSQDQDEERCPFGPSANISAIHQGAGQCTWSASTSVDSEACHFVLTGQCSVSKHHGCVFYGKPQSFRIPLLQVPSTPALGEVTASYSAADEETLRHSFEDCGKRAVYYLIEKFPVYSERTKAVIMGGHGSMQHLYFSRAEIARDVYGLADLYRNTDPRSVRLIVDIGANIGLFSIAACIAFPAAKIYAFEPHPMNYRLAKLNLVEANCQRRVKLFNLGLSRDGRDLLMKMENSLASTAFLWKDSNRLDGIPVKTISVEDLWGPSYLGDYSLHDLRVDLLKVDCEGCEYEVIPLMEGRPFKKIACEIHRRGGYQAFFSKEAAGNITRFCKRYGRGIRS